MSVGTEHEQRFVERLHKLRKARGFTAQRLAEASGMTRVAISKIEVGLRNVSLDEAIALADALGAELKDMYSPGPVTSRVEITVD
jgi:transcriptional regulator with XRE-family HTH domain